MSRFALIVLSSVILIACGGNAEIDRTLEINADAEAASSSTSSTTPTTVIDPIVLSKEIAIADAFCSNQKKLQIISTSLLSAYAPKGNGSDLNYCGGENVFTMSGADFSLGLTDYCVNARGQQVILNGGIIGITESGSNFISSIISHLSIVGNNIDLDLSGNTWDGRANDNFMNLQIIDNINANTLQLSDVSIKKGELDFGFFTFQDLNPVAFQFITHFNEDNTAGLLFIYGDADDKLIISGDNGMITAVYTIDRHDDGTWLDLPCNN
jgi:hypothetical protein